MNRKAKDMNGKAKPMNVLLILQSPGGEDCLALVPSDRLKGIDLEAINRKTVNQDGTSDDVASAIVSLFGRLDLAYDGCPRPEKADLKKYLDPKTPFIVDAVIWIGWAV